MAGYIGTDLLTLGLPNSLSTGKTDKSSVSFAVPLSQTRDNFGLLVD